MFLPHQDLVRTALLLASPPTPRLLPWIKNNQSNYLRPSRFCGSFLASSEKQFPYIRSVAAYKIFPGVENEKFGLERLRPENG
jgi:hypothetical protein